jgi:uncharacterized protein
MNVVANSSPLIALGRVRQLAIFESLFKKISIPSAVYRETVEQATDTIQKQAILQAIEQGFIEVMTPMSAHSFTRKLYASEKEVISLALDLQADLLIIDDKKARNEAREFGFEVRYTSAIIKAAAKRGFIGSYSRIINELKRLDIYLPEE